MASLGFQNTVSAHREAEGPLGGACAPLTSQPCHLGSMSSSCWKCQQSQSSKPLHALFTLLPLSSPLSQNWGWDRGPRGRGGLWGVVLGGLSWLGCQDLGRDLQTLSVKVTIAEDQSCCSGEVGDERVVRGLRSRPALCACSRVAPRSARVCALGFLAWTPSADPLHSSVVYQRPDFGHAMESCKELLHYQLSAHTGSGNATL